MVGFVTTVLISLVIVALGVYAFRWPLFNAALRAQRRRSSLRENTIEIDGHQIAYLDGGRGEPLLLLHGFGADKDHWTRIAMYFTPKYRVIAPDLPGFGESTCDHGSRYGPAEQVDRIDKFIDALGLDAVHIGGNSMGGYLAGLYTAAHAEKVKSLWMLAPAGVASAETSELMQCLDRGENPLLVQSKADFERLADLCFTKLPYVPKVFQKCLCERSIANRPFQSKIFEEIFSDPVELESALSGSDVPAQIVWGDGDRLLHFSGAAILAKAMNNATAVLMERMGHCPMLERPQETAELFLAFRATG